MGKRNETCKYFTGYQNGTCKVGVVYRELVGGPDFGWAARLPCIADSPLRKEPVATCDKREEPTADEVAAEEAEKQRRRQGTIAAIKAIRATKLNRGTVECPACKGSLGFSVASNGHIWGKCKTEGCLAWMM